MNGKGDWRRPCYVSKDIFDANWDLAFCKHNKGLSILPPVRANGVHAKAVFTCCACRRELGRDELKARGGYAWGYWISLHPEDK